MHSFLFWRLGISFYRFLHETSAKKDKRHWQIRTHNGNFSSLMRKYALSTRCNCFPFFGVKHTFPLYKYQRSTSLLLRSSCFQMLFIDSGNFLKTVALEKRNRTKEKKLLFNFSINKSTPFLNIINTLILQKQEINSILMFYFLSTLKMQYSYFCMENRA